MIIPDEEVTTTEVKSWKGRQFPSAAESFFPQDDEERAWAKENLDLEDSLHMHLRNLTMGFLVPRAAAMKSEATLERYERDGAENPKRALEVKWWRDYARDGIDDETARASVAARVTT